MRRLLVGLLLGLVVALLVPGWGVPVPILALIAGLGAAVSWTVWCRRAGALAQAVVCAATECVGITPHDRAGAPRRLGSARVVCAARTPGVTTAHEDRHAPGGARHGSVLR